MAAGRLTTPTSIDEAAAKVGLAELPIRWGHARRAAVLPPLHHDPFDRMLVAQAQLEALTLVTRDRRLALYGVPTLAA